MGFAVASGVLGGASQLLGAEMEADALEYNERMSKYEAAYAREKAKTDEKQYRVGLDRTLGSAQAIAGGTGFAQDGTNSDLIDQIRREGEIDAAMIRHGGEVTAWQAESDAELYSKQIPGVRAAGHLAAASTVFSMSSGGSGGPKTPMNKRQVGQYTQGGYQGLGIGNPQSYTNQASGAPSGGYWGGTSYTSRYSGRSSSWFGR